MSRVCVPVRIESSPGVDSPSVVDPVAFLHCSDLLRVGVRVRGQGQGFEFWFTDLLFLRSTTRSAWVCLNVHLGVRMLFTVVMSVVTDFAGVVVVLLVDTVTFTSTGVSDDNTVVAAGVPASVVTAGVPVLGFGGGVPVSVFCGGVLVSAWTRVCSCIHFAIS